MAEAHLVSMPPAARGTVRHSATLLLCLGQSLSKHPLPAPCLQTYPDISGVLGSACGYLGLNHPIRVFRCEPP